MRLPDISVKKPVSTAMVFLAVLLFGLVSLKFLPLDIMPNLEFPALTVITVYPGASADEVEEQVSKPLEAVLSGAENLKQISSKSRENVCFIQMQYEWGTNVTEAANNARDIIELVKSRMPSGARPPIIYKINSSMMPIVVYGITAQENYYGLDNIIDEKIAGPIRKVDGVGTVIYLGQPKREIKIKVHPQKLAAYNISIARMATILKAENISIPGGTIKTDKHDFAVQVPGQIENIAELEEIAISSFNGKIIRLKDIAEVEDGFASDDEYARNARGMGAAFMVQKQSGVNTLDVVKSVREKMEEVRADLPADVKVDEVLATDEIITESIGSLTSSFWWALLFVIIVVFAFLREWRSSLIIFLTIPFSLISSFIVMYTIGWTINIFSLMSLIIAIGMVVDNAIVVLENITQHLERGSRPKEAAIFAAGEMGRPIIASTLTTLMVFIPMVFMGGIVGILFKQLAILTSVAMIASLITSLSLTPMMASQVLKGKKNQKKKRKSLLYRLSERNLVALENGYKKVLAWSSNINPLQLFLQLRF